MNIRSTFRPLVLGSLLALFAVACGGATDEALSANNSAASLTEQGAAHRAFDPARMLTRLDRNGDGRVEVTELPERMRERMGSADGDHDGVITVAEVTSHMQARRAERFARVDANHDGAITAEEAGPRWTFMSRADANTDGRVSADELSQAHAAGGFRGHHGGRGRPGGPGRHGGPGAEGGFGRHGGPGAEGGFDPSRMLTRFDRNGDGRVELTELPERMQARVGTADANHDGVLAADEFSAHVAQQRAAHQARELQAPTVPTAPVAPVAPTQE